LKLLEKHADFWFYLMIVYCVLLSTFMYYCLYIQHLLLNTINESVIVSQSSGKVGHSAGKVGLIWFDLGG